MAYPMIPPPTQMGVIASVTPAWQVYTCGSRSRFARSQAAASHSAQPLRPASLSRTSLQNSGGAGGYSVTILKFSSNTEILIPTAV